ncbi:TPA: hypothetical protein ACIAIE_004077 [Serratia fonticola]
MQDNDLQQRLKAIFDTGIHYNTALLVYAKRIKNLDILYNWINIFPPDIKTFFSKIIQGYLNAICHDERDFYLNKIKHWAPHPIMCTLAVAVNAESGPSWDNNIMLSSQREIMSARRLLVSYFKISSLTKEFTYFDGAILSPVFEELESLENLIKNQAFICNRVRLNNSSESELDVYYDDQKTSQRQALQFSLALVEKNDCLDMLKTPFLRKKLSDLDKLLLALTWQNVSGTLSKQAFLNFLGEISSTSYYDKYIDGRALERGMKSLEDYKKTIKSFYELDRFQDDRERQSVNSYSKVLKSEQADARTRLVGFLSSCIVLYATMCAHSKFFNTIALLHYRIREQHSGDGMIIMNNLSRFSKNMKEEDVTTQGNAEFRIAYLNNKEIVMNLNKCNLPFIYWGYYFNEKLIPRPLDVIGLFVNIKKLCGDNLNNVTHEHLYLAQQQAHFSLKPIAGLLFPPLNENNQVMYSPGNPIRIFPIPKGRKCNIIADIQSALDLVDRKTFQQNLERNKLTDKIDDLEKFLWGIFYYYENSFSEKKLSIKKCIEKIDSIYPSNKIGDKKFRSAIEMAEKLISEQKNNY